MASVGLMHINKNWLECVGGGVQQNKCYVISFSANRKSLVIIFFVTLTFVFREISDGHLYNKNVIKFKEKLLSFSTIDYDFPVRAYSWKSKNSLQYLLSTRLYFKNILHPKQPPSILFVCSLKIRYLKTQDTN